MTDDPTTTPPPGETPIIPDTTSTVRRRRRALSSLPWTLILFMLLVYLSWAASDISHAVTTHAIDASIAGDPLWILVFYPAVEYCFYKFQVLWLRRGATPRPYNWHLVLWLVAAGEVLTVGVIVICRIMGFPWG